MSKDELASYWAGARAKVQAQLIPVAKRTKCIPPGATLDSLRRSVQGLDPDDPKRVVAMSLLLLKVICAKGETLAKLRAQLYTIASSQPEPARIRMQAAIDAAILPDHQDLACTCDRALDWLGGYLSALDATNTFRVQRGAKVRRTQGNATRERVKAASSGYRHLPRDTASALIATAIGKSPGTVRRLLSEIFPGDDWHKSIDLSQHIK